jgi:hypothetical protein
MLMKLIIFEKKYLKNLDHANDDLDLIKKN